MSTIKKDHMVGTGTGAAAGAIAGSAVGIVGGPLGMVAGAAVGSIIGAGVGDSLAEIVNPTIYEDHWKSSYQKTPYYAAGREWSDYEPAYKLGYSAYETHRGDKFDDIQAELEFNWEASRGESRLAWVDAKGAVQDGWDYVEHGVTTTAGDTTHAAQ